MPSYKRSYILVFFIPIAIILILMIFSHKADVGTERSGPERSGWNYSNYSKIAKWMAGLKAWRPEHLVVLLDCDNTAWAGDIADSMFLAGVDHDLISWDNAPVLSDYPFDVEGTTPFDYYEHLYEHDPVVAYNYVAQAFAGLTLRNAFDIFTSSRDRSDFPTAYAPLKEMLSELSEQGVTVGFASASPIFMVAPMLELSGFKAPLWNVEGIDVYVRGSEDDSREVLLSNLIHSEGLKSWNEVLQKFGDMKITGRVSEIVNSREGKAVGGISIASRHVARWNSEHSKEDAITFNKLRLAAVFGDNFGPFSDLKDSSPFEKGNDQGLVRALPFIYSGGLVMDIHCAIDEEAPNLEKYRHKYLNFLELARQSEDLASDIDFIAQVGVCKGRGRGSFLPNAMISEEIRTAELPQLVDEPTGLVLQDAQL
jgi:hypothetical protein